MDETKAGGDGMRAGGWGGFCALCLLGLALRLHDVGGKPFWMDEVTTIHRASLPLGAMISDSLFFHQLPGFFIVTSWVLPFGQSEAWVRLPSMLFGGLSCGLGYGVARALGGWRAGWLAGLLIALSPAQVQYGQEARSYAMLICAILLALWGLARLARDPQAAARPFSRGLPWAWAAYGLGTCAALNILGVALLWFAAATLAGPVIGLVARSRGFWRNWLLVQAGILLLSAPWYVAIELVGQRGALGGLDWVPKLDAARLWWGFAGTYLLRESSLIAVHVFPAAVPGLGWLVLALALAGLCRAWRRPAAFAVLATAIFLLPLALLGVSLVNPVWMPRYLLWSAPPLFIAAGLGLGVLPKPARSPVLAALALLAGLNLRPYYHEETKPRWDLAAAQMQALRRPGDLLLVDDPQAVSLMNLYLARAHDAPIRPGQWTTELAQARARLAAGGRVWAVQGQVGQVDHESQAQFLRRIAGLGAPGRSLQAGRAIILLEYGPRAVAGAGAALPPA